MTPYQEQMIDVYRNRDANKKEKLRTVPTNFPDIAGSQLDLLRGVQWADPKKPGKGLISGSAGPLDPQTKAALVAKASAYYQESGNAIDAVQRAFQDIGGESGLSDGAETPWENDASGYIFDDNFKYKTLYPNQVPQDLPVDTAARQLTPPTAPVPPGRVRVQALDGTIGTIDESELFDAEMEGYKVIR